MKIKLEFFSTLAFLITISSTLLATPIVNRNSLPHSVFIDEAKIMSQDENFNELFNSLFNISSQIAKQNKIDVLRRYSENKASDFDISELIKAFNVNSRKEINQIFESIHKKRILLNQKFSFLQDKDNGQNIFKNALILSAQNGNFSVLKTKGIDCLFIVMGMFSACYIFYNECLQNPNSSIDCDEALSVCLGLAFVEAALCIS